jgi:hypothetical protein
VLPVERPSVTRERLGRVLALLLVAGFAAAAAVGRAAPGVDAAAPGWPLAMIGVGQALALGALIGTSHRHRRRWSPATAGAVAAAAALALARLDLDEGAAAWPGAAALGALAAIACAWAAGESARFARRPHAAGAVTHLVAADYPLVGLVWLTTAAVWLLAADAGDLRGTAATACAALFGGSLLASVRASRGPAARGGGLATAALVGAWAAVAVTPLAVHAPGQAFACAATVAAIAGGTAPWLGATVRERRFEQRALVRAAPALAGAVVLAWTGRLSGQGLGSWDGAVLWPTMDGGFAAYAALGAVVGYAAAELRSRRREPRGEAWRRLSPDARLLVVSAELARAVLGGAPNLWHALAALAAARLGAALYHSYREHVQALRAAGRDGRAVYTPVR